MNYTGFGVVL